MTLSTRQAVRQALVDNHLERVPPAIDMASLGSGERASRSPTSPIATEAWPGNAGNFPRRSSVERGSPLAGSQPRRRSSSGHSKGYSGGSVGGGNSGGLSSLMGLVSDLSARIRCRRSDGSFLQARKFM